MLNLYFFFLLISSDLIHFSLQLFLANKVHTLFTHLKKDITMFKITENNALSLRLRLFIITQYNFFSFNFHAFILTDNFLAFILEERTGFPVDWRSQCRPRAYYLCRVKFKVSVGIMHTFILEVSWHVALFYCEFKTVTEQIAVVNPINFFKSRI